MSSHGNDMNAPRAEEGVELLPCPFCGGTAAIERRDVEPQGDPWYGRTVALYVQCSGCGAALFDRYFHEGFADARAAAEAWNIRR